MRGGGETGRKARVFTINGERGRSMKQVVLLARGSVEERAFSMCTRAANGLAMGGKMCAHGRSTVMVANLKLIVHKRTISRYKGSRFSF